MPVSKQNSVISASGAQTPGSVEALFPLNNQAYHYYVFLLHYQLPQYMLFAPKRNYPTVGFSEYSPVEFVLSTMERQIEFLGVRLAGFLYFHLSFLKVLQCFILGSLRTERYRKSNLCVLVRK